MQFVNTVDLEQGEERLSSPAELANWLLGAGACSQSPASPGRSRPRASRCVRLCERSCSPTTAGPGFPPRRRADAGRRRPAGRGCSFAFACGEIALEPEAAGVDAALGRLLAIVQSAVAQNTWERLKACREHTCEWAFYDHTKNRSGAWCNMRRVRQPREGAGLSRAPACGAGP